MNGVEFKFNTEVQDIKTEDGTLSFRRTTALKSRFVVNAAGVYADKFHNMMSEEKIHITPRRGDYRLPILPHYHVVEFYLRTRPRRIYHKSDFNTPLFV